MGSAVARLFAQEGAAVCVADRDEEGARETARTIVDSGGQSMSVALDVCDAQVWDEAVNATEKTYGRLDLMVNLSGSNVRVGFEEQTEAMQTSITFAREYLKGLNCKREQLKYLCENAIRAGVQGNRGELFAAQVARANAALNGEDIVTADDLQMGVKLCIAPRGTEIQAPPPDDDMMQQPPPPPPPPPPDMEQEETEEDEEEQEQEQPEQEQV